MEFSGRLSAFPVSNLLQWGGTERATGALVLRRPRQQKSVQFEAGSVVGCVSDLPADFYGPSLLCNGLVDEAQLLEALQWSEENDARLGSALAALGMLEKEQVERSLTDHIRDQVCDLFLWRHGIFYFEERGVRPETLLPQRLNPMALALEGSRWADEVARIRRVLVHDEIVVHPVLGSRGGAENPLEARILRLLPAEGARLSELHRRVQGARFRFLQTVFELTLRDQLEIGDVGEPGSEDSQELEPTELLLERAIERRIALQRSQMDVPLEVLGGLYVWLTESDEGLEEIGLSERLDGTTRLRALLDPESAEGEVAFERLIDALRKGRLALLPDPLKGAQPARRRSGLAALFGGGRKRS